MKFYEAKFLCPPDTEGAHLDEVSKETAALVQGSLEVHHTTIHARPASDFPTQYACAIFVATNNVRELHEFAGKMARLHGYAMANYQELGQDEDTLNYKAIEGNDELEEDAIREAVGADEEFTITNIHDRADE